MDLRWNQVDSRTASVHVRRAKSGTPTTHPILGDELRTLRRLQREQEPKSPFVTSERGAPFTTAGFARMIERAGTEAKLGFKAHPHMLRHACGYALANRRHDTRALQAYLGHRNIQHTVRYTELRGSTNAKAKQRKMALRRAQYAEIREIDQTIQLHSLAILEEVMRHFYWKARILEGMGTEGDYDGRGRKLANGRKKSRSSGIRRSNRFAWAAIRMRQCCRRT